MLKYLSAILCGQAQFVPPVYDTDAITFFNAVTANAGTLSNTTRVAANTFVVSAKANNYWTKINRINLFCGDQLASCLVPLKIGDGSATETLYNNSGHLFTNSDYVENTGLTSDGTKTFSTGLIGGVSLAQNSLSIALVITSGKGIAGVETSSRTRLEVDRDTPLTKVTMHDQGNNLGVGACAEYALGTRTSSSRLDIYLNGASAQGGNLTTIGTMTSSSPFYVFSSFWENAGVPTEYSTGTMAGYMFGAGFTSSDALNFYNDLSLFNAALGR